ncbi:MAG: hypothetical protein QM296_09950 [Bacillota bacterium]|nr:hypothetical protein [Bacillota bacterium]
MKAPRIAKRYYRELRSEMALRGLRQADIAKVLGRSVNYVDRIMAGHGSFLVREAVEIIQFLELDEQDFVRLFVRDIDSAAA